MSEHKTQPISKKLRLFLWGLLLFAFLCTCVAGFQASRTLNSPFPSFLLDPYGFFSTAYLPTWGNDALPYENQVVAVEREPVTTQSVYASTHSQQVQKLIEKYYQNGHKSILVTFQNSKESFEKRYPIRTTTLLEVGFFFGIYCLTAWFILWAGILVCLLAGQRIVGWVYLFWSTSSFVFLTFFFDYHTQAHWAPFFSASTLSVPLGFLWLAYAFPAPPIRHKKFFYSTLLLMTFLGFLTALCLWGTPWSEIDTSSIRRNIPFFAILGIISLACSILIRLKQAENSKRREIISALWGFSFVPIFVAATLGIDFFWGIGFFHLVLPFFTLSIPLSIGYSLIRHNILTTTIILTQRLLLVPILLGTSIVAVLVSIVTYAFLKSHGFENLLILLIGIAVFLLLFPLTKKLSRRLFFSAVSEFRPTIEQLSDQLASLTSSMAVQHTVETVVCRWLPTAWARVISLKNLDTISYLPKNAREELSLGKQVWTKENPKLRCLLLPMRSLHKVQGVLVLAPKHQSTLYTSDDVALLNTIASLGALALHNVAVMSQLEAFRKMEVEVTQGEKRHALELLSAEISHEIAYPLNFFRYLLKSFRKHSKVDEQDLDIGQEEIERLERMLSMLRKLELSSNKMEPVPLVATIRRVLGVIREQISQKNTQVFIEVPEETTLLSSPDPLLQLLANLLRNAVQAIEENGQIGVRTFFTTKNAEMILEVWDSGKGVPKEIEKTIFNPWVSTRRKGTGLGLAISQRIVRSFGWTISFQRKENRTSFCVHIPVDGKNMFPKTPGKEVL